MAQVKGLTVRHGQRTVPVEQVIAGLVVELAPWWQARHRDRLAARACSRHIGAGAKHRFGFADCLLATLVHLRHGLTHDVVAAWVGVHRSTITRSVVEVRPLLAERGCQVSDGVGLRTIADWHTWAMGSRALVWLAVVRACVVGLCLVIASSRGLFHARVAGCR
ncbi:transposase family protein [Micromonospora sp. KC721]|uniref:helix-turn-helix domain-containing protein n=1 Tax=Micromonospora sp. KC721 TaxID=2530380 RepID=UPI001FB6F568|nr:transposase family protein [Micromonospora sp. KC721]